MKRILFLTFLGLLVILVWFHKGLILGGGEEGLPFYSVQQMVATSTNLWLPWATGIFAIDFLPRTLLAYIFSLSQYMHIPVLLFQMMFYYFILIVGLISMYLLAEEVLEKVSQKKDIAVIAGIFYLLNPYAMSQVWGRGIYSQDAIWALLPLSILFFLKGLKQRNLFFTIFVALSSYLFSLAFGLVTNIVVYWSIIFLFAAYWVCKKRTIKDLIFTFVFFMASVILWCLTEAWWFFPLFLYSNNIFGGKLANVSENIGTLKGVSPYFPFTSIIRLIQDYYFSNPGSYGAMYMTLPFQLISWVAPSMLVIGILSLKKAKDLLFFFILFIFSLVFSLGSNPPFGNWFIFIFNNFSFMKAFRNPYEKYGIVFMFAYTLIFAYGVYSLWEYLQRKFKILENVSVLFFAICIFIFIGVIYLWPISVVMSRTGIKVPKAYSILNNLLQKDTGDYRLFLTPFAGDGIQQRWNGTSYNGLDSAVFLFSRPALYDLHTPFTYDISESIRKYMYQIDVVPVLQLMQAKYYIARDDAILVPTDQEEALTQKVNSIDLSSQYTICPSQKSLPNTNALLQISCSVSPDNADLSGISYAVINANSDKEVTLELQITDAKGVTGDWVDFSDKDSYIYPGKLTSINIYLLKNNSYSTKLDWHNIKSIVVIAHPVLQETISQFSIDTISFSKAVAAMQKEFIPMNSENQVRLYKPIHFVSQPTLTTVKHIKTFPRMFDFFADAANYREEIPYTGYIINYQNTSLDSALLKNDSSTRISYKKLISPTRYYMSMLSPGKTYIVFNQTFNSGWKVIPDVQEKGVENTFFNNLSIIRRIAFPENRHAVVNGYANLWIDTKGHTSYAIIFMPQVYADIGWVVSISTLILVAVYGIIAIIKRNAKK